VGNNALTQVFTSESKARPARRKTPGAKAARPMDKERLMAEFEVERTLGWLFHDINRLLKWEFEGRIKALSLTRAQWWVLVMLRRTGGGQTQTELADQTDIEKAPLGKTLDRLEEGGWIARKDDPKDRRARRVYATAKIEKFLPQLAAAAQGTFARTLQGMRQSEVKDLIARLTMLKRNLGGAED
jgi:MarR family transcriptional regulator, transcriptional regulator for hemolysin